ncbi:MAG: hypothetical protein KC422_15590 [Trueperaceae bacterium]|nr:hypothetical protein [Trueperaceae bacterium]
MPDSTFRETLQSANLNLLLDANLNDLYRAFAIPQAWRPLAKWIFLVPARRLAQRLIRFDNDIARVGLKEAAKSFLVYLGTEVKIEGSVLQNSGPLILAINHPGLADILAVLGFLDRADIKIIAAERPLLRALPNLAQSLIFLTEASQLRPSNIREAKRHLEQKGCILLFPKGAIEPDPLLHPRDAMDCVTKWASSLGIFSTLHRETQMQAAILKGIRHPKSFSHPLVRLRRDPKEKDWLAATLQLLLKRYQNQAITLSLSPAYDQVEDVLEAAKAIIRQNDHS